MYIASDKIDWELYDAMRFRYYITRYLYKPLVSGHLFLVYKVVFASIYNRLFATWIVTP